MIPAELGKGPHISCGICASGLLGLLSTTCDHDALCALTAAWQVVNGGVDVMLAAYDAAVAGLEGAPVVILTGKHLFKAQNTQLAESK